MLFKIITKTHTDTFQGHSSVFSKLRSQSEEPEAEVLRLQSPGPIHPLAHIPQSPGHGATREVAVGWTRHQAGGPVPESA